MFFIKHLNCVRPELWLKWRVTGITWFPRQQWQSLHRPRWCGVKLYCTQFHVCFAVDSFNELFKQIPSSEHLSRVYKKKPNQLFHSVLQKRPPHKYLPHHRIKDIVWWWEQSVIFQWNEKHSSLSEVSVLLFFTSLQWKDHTLKTFYFTLSRHYFTYFFTYVCRKLDACAPIRAQEGRGTYPTNQPAHWT